MLKTNSRHMSSCASSRIDTLLFCTKYKKFKRELGDTLSYDTASSGRRQTRPKNTSVVLGARHQAPTRVPQRLSTGCSDLSSHEASGARRPPLGGGRRICTSFFSTWVHLSRRVTSFLYKRSFRKVVSTWLQVTGTMQRVLLNCEEDNKNTADCS